MGRLNYKKKIDLFLKLYELCRIVWRVYQVKYNFLRSRELKKHYLLSKPLNKTRNILVC